MTTIQFRDTFRLTIALLLNWLYLPHLIIALCSSKREIIFSDIRRMKQQINICLPNSIALLYLLHNNSYYRAIFYHRLGPVVSAFIRWYRPSDKYFMISDRTKIAPGFAVFHPYATVINAESIGSNFTCLQCTTIGAKGEKRPIIGDNVSLGANVNIIGGVEVGNNVTIGAGSVVVKDIPDNCIAAGNPAHVIKYIDPII